MIDYRKMSDFEINKRVALALGLKIKFISLDSDDKEVGIIVGKKYTTEKNNFDPCNNPADAWPIILEHGISVAFDKNEAEWVAWGDFALDLAGWNMEEEPAEYEHHVNPLRAAMIVLLMMQDEKIG